MLEDKQFKFTFVFFILCWSALGAVSNEKFTGLSRTKRTLIWEKGNSRLQIITGFGVPLDLNLETVIIGAVIKGNYVLPSNASELRPFGNTVYYERKKRSLSRWDIYDFLAQLWQMRGFGGRACLLRAICELSHRPVDKSFSLFDELIHTLFKPTSTKEPVRHHSDNEYYAAEKMGRRSGDSCISKFPDCGISLVDFFTTS